MGFEPMCPKPDNRISSAARYDHFDTFPYINIKLLFESYRNAVYNRKHYSALLRRASSECDAFLSASIPFRIQILSCAKDLDFV